MNLQEKLWLAQFAKEEIHAAVDGKTPKNNKFNKTKKKTRAIFQSNNERNRCTWTRERAKGMAEYLEDHKETLLSNNPAAFLAVKMDLEKDGWVNNNGDVIKTEKEVIDKYKLEEKIRKSEAKKKK